MIFSNFTNIRHLIYWKSIIWAKSDLAIINSVCEKVLFTIKGQLRMLFFSFCYFHFPKFQMTIVKNLKEKPSFSIMDFEGSHEVLLRQRYLWFTYNETTALLTFSENSMEIHFVSLFFVNERNITTSLLMISLKLTVVHYANVSSSSINKSYLRAVEYGISFLFVFFISFLFMFILTRLLSKTLWQNYHSLIQIHKMYFKM